MSEPGILPKPIPFGKYYLLERINVGGMAEVYKAKAFGVEGFERLLAVKKILASIAEDESFINMFIDEAKIAGQLHHPNIAQIFDLGKEDGSYFIALEYIAGKDLKTSFERARRIGEKVSIPRICYTIMKICEGLAYAHHKKDPQGNDLNIVHRDISPQNILISYEGEVKIIDFGIAKAQGKTSQTQVGILKGKFSYMSPEQVRGLHVDHRSDLFSLGILFYELLTLERLFLGESDFDTLEKIRKVEMSPPSLYNPHIPKSLEDIVLKSLARAPEERYQSAYEFAEAIETFMRSQNYYFSNKDLAVYMKESYSADIEFENKKQEYYRSLNLQPIAQEIGKSRSASAPSPLDSGLSWGDDELETQIFDRAPNEDEFAIGDSDIIYSDEMGLGENLADMNSSSSSLAHLKENSEESITVERDRWQQQEGLQLDHALPSKRQSSQSDSALQVQRTAPPTAQMPAVSAPQSSLHPSDSVVAQKKQGSSIPWLGVLLALLVVAVGVPLYFMMSGKSDARVVFEIEPSAVQIYLDNALIYEGETPFSYDASPGDAQIRVVRDGYDPFEVTTRLLAGETHKLTHSLKKSIAQTLDITLQSQPSGATVIMNNKALEGTTPLTLKDVNVGEKYQLTLTKDGYFDTPHELTITNADETMLEVSLKPTHVALKLDSEPSRSDYSIFDAETEQRIGRGRTPATLDELDASLSYRVVVERRGYETWEQVFQPGDDSTATLTATLVREEVVQEPVKAPATAPVPDRAASASSPSPTPTPSSGRSPSPDRASASTSGRDPAPAPRAEPTPVPPQPKVAGTGTLSVASRPAARVYINDQDTGRYTPIIDMELAAGKRHKISLINADFGLDKVYYIELSAGENKRIINR